MSSSSPGMHTTELSVQTNICGEVDAGEPMHVCVPTIFAVVWRISILFGVSDIILTLWTLLKTAFNFSIAF